MKKFKKLFLVVSIVAVLMVMMVVSVSAMAPSIEVPSNMSSTPNIYCVQYDTEVSDMNDIKLSPQIIVVEICDTNGDCTYSAILLKSFYEDFDINSNMNSDDVWNKIISMPSGYESGYEWYFGYLNNGYFDNNGILYLLTFEESIKKAYSEQYLYWIDYSEEYANEQKEPLETQIGELNTTITEKDAVITEKDTAISTLQGENANLQIDVDSLNTQVENLVEEKTVINSELKALEAKMEREIDKAYEQGYEDADGFKFGPVIACFSVISLFVTIISFVVTIKRKKRR